ncbi:MAG: FAD-dependent oxidoreductase [Candidatus Sericytochromatia bacterium]
MKQVNVVGSGLAGTLLALTLAREGLDVTLYERRSDPRRVAQSAGRSINLALSARGLHALEAVGLQESILKQALPMRGRMMHSRKGELQFSRYGLHDHEYINSISRAGLNAALLDAAEAAGVTIYFQQRCTGMDFAQRRAQFCDDRNGEAYTLDATPILAADGAGSALRQSLVQRTRVDYHQEYLPHGYKELTIPPGPDGDFQLDPAALHIWPRHSFMLIALPNPDKSFTCTLFLAFDGDASGPGFDQLDSEARVQAFFEREFADLLPLIPDLTRQFAAHPTGALATVRCAPWYVEDQLLLVGDAAHAIVPFFGQGMNAAFEDCTLLLAAWREHGPDWGAVFAHFYRERKPNADAIAQLALDNFVEMRDKVADPVFLLHKQVGLQLEARYPDHFVPKYSLVSFHRVPYADALRHGELQQALLTQLCEGLTRPEDVDWTLADSLMADFIRLAPPLEPAGTRAPSVPS